MNAFSAASACTTSARLLIPNAPPSPDPVLWPHVLESLQAQVWHLELVMWQQAEARDAELDTVRARLARLEAKAVSRHPRRRGSDCNCDSKCLIEVSVGTCAAARAGCALPSGSEDIECGSQCSSCKSEARSGIEVGAQEETFAIMPNEPQRALECIQQTRKELLRTREELCTVQVELENAVRERRAAVEEAQKERSEKERLQLKVEPVVQLAESAREENRRLEHEKARLQEENVLAHSEVLTIWENAHMIAEDMEGRLEVSRGLHAVVAALQASAAAAQEQLAVAEARTATALRERDEALSEAARRRLESEEALAETEHVREEKWRALQDARSIREELAKLHEQRDTALMQMGRSLQEKGIAVSGTQSELPDRKAYQAEFGETLNQVGASLEISPESVRALSDQLPTLHNECSCPILHGLMRDPVVAADGHTYEREAITRWLSEHGTSPLTGLALPSRSLFPNVLAANVARLLRDGGGASSDDVDDTRSKLSTASSANPQEEALDPAMLAHAIRRGDVSQSLALLARRNLPGLNETYGRVLESVLHLAARKNLVEVCEAILARPDFTEVNRQDSHGLTALHDAAMFEKEALCLKILEHPGFTAVRVQSDPMFRFRTARGIAVWKSLARVVEAIDRAM